MLLRMSLASELHTDEVRIVGHYNVTACKMNETLARFFFIYRSAQQ